jgi:hypothetical protein
MINGFKTKKNYFAVLNVDNGLLHTSKRYWPRFILFEWSFNRIFSVFLCAKIGPLKIK